MASKQIQKNIQQDINYSKGRLETLSKNLVKKGILEIAPDLKNPYIFFHGQSSLLNDEIVSKDLDQIRKLFDEIENKTNFLDILENTNIAKRVQIFIGSQNLLFKHSGLSAFNLNFTVETQVLPSPTPSQTPTPIATLSSSTMLAPTQTPSPAQTPSVIPSSVPTPDVSYPSDSNKDSNGGLGQLLRAFAVIAILIGAVVWAIRWKNATRR